MGVVDDGTTYYWNEFNLQSDSGETTTLVYEVTDRGAGMAALHDVRAAISHHCRGRRHQARRRSA